ncbi:MAG: disulfide bond formation protein DsbA [Actinomycetota bacterium]
MTARWVVDTVAPERDLSITWQPISLLEKNKPDPDSSYYAPVARTHRLLRVMESLRKAEGDKAVFPLYWEYGRRIHHDRDYEFDPADVLSAIGADTSHAAAFDDEAWDAEIKTRMGVGLGLTGEDVGTPIIAMDDANGDRVALFGPVITRVPPPDLALQMWDGFVAMAQVPGFWEVKRTRTESPEFGERP